LRDRYAKLSKEMEERFRALLDWINSLF
jgi:hypothetical protein